MDPFPERHDLISLFSQEPELIDAEVPWFYNTLEFTGSVGGTTYLVRISPAYGELELQLIRLGELTLRLSLSRVAGLTVHENHKEAVLMAKFAPETALLPQK